MGNKATYKITFDVRSTVKNYFDISVTATGGWDNLKVHYDEGRYGDGIVIPDGLVIDIPPFLEGIGPIQSSIESVDPFIPFNWFGTTRREIGSDVTVRIISNYPAVNHALFRDNVRRCRVPDTNPVQTRCLIVWEVWVKFASALRVVQNDFSLSYFESSNSFNNNRVRVDNTNGALSYGNKQVQSNDTLLSTVTVAAITDLSNENSQYQITITLKNEEDILLLDYDASLCPVVVSVTFDDTKLIVTTSVDVPAIGLRQDIRESSISIPDIVRFYPTYPSSNVIYLTPRDAISLLDLVGVGQSMSMSFLAYGLIV